MKKKILSNLLSITAGSFFLALGINFFLAPSKISVGGVSGIGILLFHIFKIPISVTSLVLNVILLVFSFKTLSKSDILKTLSGIAMSSLFLQLIPVSAKPPEDIIISSLCGGLLVGAGIGIVVSKNASTGGSDFAAIMLKKLFPAIPFSFLIFFIDSSVIAVSGIAFKNFYIFFYSLLSLFISARTTDLLLVRGDFAKSVMIVSQKSNEISSGISAILKRGSTGLYGKGMYLKENKTVVLCVIKPKELPALKDIVHKTDPDAFLIVFDAREVLGEGFK